MSDTAFVNQVTVVPVGWTQDVNDHVYRGKNLTYATTTGSANAYTLTIPATSLYSGLNSGDTLSFKANFANTGAATLTVVGASSFTAKSIVRRNGQALLAGDIPNNSICEVLYDGTNFQLLSAYSLTTPGCVLMYQDTNQSWVVLNADGTPVNISSTTTQGFLEAVNAALKPLNTRGYDLVVIGGDVSTGGAQVIQCGGTTIPIPATQGKKIRIGAVTINWTSAIGSNPGMTVDSSIMGDIDLSGAQLAYFGTGTALLIKPVNGVPLDTVVGFADGRLHVTTVAIGGGGAATCVAFDPTNGAITGKFDFDEVNLGAYGIRVLDSTNSLNHCQIRCGHVHLQTNTCVQIGQTAPTTFGNEFFFGISPGTGATALGVAGTKDKYTVSIHNGEGTPSVGILLAAAAAQNSFTVLKNAATTKVTDNSTSGDNEGIYGSWKPRASVNRNGTNQTAIATATYTKVQFTTKLFDTSTAFDASTNYRWTPGRPGYARISARAAWNTSVDTMLMFTSIYKNGSLLHESAATTRSTSGNVGPAVSALVAVSAATDYFEIFCRQDSGGNLDLSGATAQTWAMFEMVDG